MKTETKDVVDKVTIISRYIFISIFVLMLLVWVLLEIKNSLSLSWAFLDIVIYALQILAFLMFIFSWLSPGLLILLGNPMYVYAWLRGINPIGFPNKSWNDLSNSDKLLAYFAALFLSGFAILFLIWLFKVFTT